MKAVSSAKGDWHQELWLILSGTLVTDSGLRHLAASERVGCLSLAHTAISDVGLEHLAGLPKLYSLDLEGTKITDAALPLLEEMKVREVNVSNTRVTAAAKKAMQAQAPRMNLDWESQ